MEDRHSGVHPTGGSTQIQVWARTWPEPRAAEASVPYATTRRDRRSLALTRPDPIGRSPSRRRRRAATRRRAGRRPIHCAVSPTTPVPGPSCRRRWRRRCARRSDPGSALSGCIPTPPRKERRVMRARAFTFGEHIAFATTRSPSTSAPGALSRSSRANATSRWTAPPGSTSTSRFRSARPTCPVPAPWTGAIEPSQPPTARSGDEPAHQVLGTSSETIARHRTHLAPVSAADEPAALFTLCFDEVTELPAGLRRGRRTRAEHPLAASHGDQEPDQREHARDHQRGPDAGGYPGTRRAALARL